MNDILKNSIGKFMSYKIDPARKSANRAEKISVRIFNVGVSKWRLYCKREREREREDEEVE